ncbi:uncharacterized protein Tco025E_06398 [Trypanosoma conorhini]|uniref:Uncharacterized protein n=1 Tax=Trypanosoma conorhini TaxID=83891 RepID=A0A422P5E5_9TRYP|nr:uncharacterized protein Tco025E_06398 [Trypanosoma conorhini]RNF12952.1 hypothetical protein Tco025E_06398 [Trypanosoma conorhini]
MRASRVYCARLRRLTRGGVPFLRQQQQQPGDRAARSTAACLSDAEQAASALACRLLERHRQRRAARLHDEATASCGGAAVGVVAHQPREEVQEGAVANALARHKRRPAVDALAGHGKTAVLANLARSLDARLAETRDLVAATDREWEALTARSRVSAACADADTRSAVRAWVRSSRTDASASLAAKFAEHLTPFDAVMQRYGGAVTQHRPRAAASEVVLGWRVNMPASLTRRGTLRCALARSEQLSRRSEWSRVRERQLPLGTHCGGGAGGLIEGGKEREVESPLAGRACSSRPFASPAFRRYCLQFGGSTLRQVAFLADPALYFVLCNWRSTGTESLLEVRQKAETLTHRYASTLPLP